ncbi:DUF2637 domain-containing protein [Streptomyces sp. NPDC005356]|uniref:DUF2637 domain-containing protein n=1 Tax=Streptomyces sp. NPDC005356 TaxID=3157167 RepID=UPI0033B5F8F3
MRQDQGTGQTTRSAPSPKKEPITLTKAHKILVGVVGAGATIIAGIGFAGSYAAVRELAIKKGFGNFAYAFPLGIDAGIVVLLALDLLLTWIRIPFPLLRQTAWLLTAATIAFNGAAAWPDPLGVSMHAVIPVLFVVAVEAARHAIGRIADITADKHMEGVRLTRWLLSPLPTFLLWRRMKLWELRSYEATISMEQERLVYQARLRSRFGRAWRRKAPVESLMPLRLARYGVPLRETAAAGLAAADIPIPVELQRLDKPETAEVGRVGELSPAPASTETVPSQSSEVPPEVEYQGGYAPTLDMLPPWHDEYGPLPMPEPQVPTPTPHWDQYATAPSAAHGGNRPHIVQARVDLDGWAEETTNPQSLHGDDALSPIGDSPELAPEPEPDPQPEAPELTGVDLLEHLYLQLPLEERGQSASKLAELLAPGAGFTAGTTRKYLRPILDKHATKSGD